MSDTPKRLSRTGTITTMDTMTSPSSSLPNTRVLQRANRNAIQLALIGILVGFTIGFLSAIGQYVLPDSIKQIANSGAMWVIIAFVMGRYAPSLVMAILVGALALFGELAGFYAIAWRLHLAITPLWVVFAWGVVAVIAGPILATGGYVSRTKGGFTRLLGMSTLGATFIGEGLFLLLAIDPAPKKIMALWLAIAAIITVILTWRERKRIQVWAMTVCLGVVFLMGFEILTRIEIIRPALTQWLEREF
jgi:hypothetical protein